MKNMRKILLLCIVACLMVGCGSVGEMSLGSGKNAAEQESAISVDGRLQMDMPEGWEVYEDPAPFDLRMTNSRSYTGVFVYSYSDLAEDVVAADIFDYQISDLMSRRENVSVYQEQETKNADDKTITQITYAGEKDLTKNAYHFSLVEFERGESFAIIIQSILFSDFEGNQEELDYMVESVKLTAEKVSN